MANLDGVRPRTLPLLDPDEAVALLGRIAGTSRIAAEPDPAAEVARIADHLCRWADGGKVQLIVTTGGTGLGPRDFTPQATRSVLDYEIPGFGEQRRAAGRRSTPLADLSRSLAGVLGRALVVAVPGSPRGALESLAAIEPLIEHALETLGGDTEHS